MLTQCYNLINLTGWTPAATPSHNALSSVTHNALSSVTHNAPSSVTHNAHLHTADVEQVWLVSHQDHRLDAVSGQRAADQGQPVGRDLETRDAQLTTIYSFRQRTNQSPVNLGDIDNIRSDVLLP